MEWKEQPKSEHRQTFGHFRSYLRKDQSQEVCVPLMIFSDVHASFILAILVELLFFNPKYFLFSIILNILNTFLFPIFHKRK